MGLFGGTQVKTNKEESGAECRDVDCSGDSKVLTELQIAIILGDPGAVSGGGKSLSGREKKIQCSWNLQGVFIDKLSLDCQVYKKHLSSSFWNNAKFVGMDQIKQLNAG